MARSSAVRPETAKALLDMLAALIGDEVEAIGVSHGLDGRPFRLDLRDRLVVGWIHQPGRQPGGGVDIRVLDGIDQFSPIVASETIALPK